MITRCPICPGDHRCVQPDGPETSDILFIGERPGREENKIGRPFIGPSGREFNENYLWLAGLEREGIRITNSVLCGAEGNRKPSEKEIRGCAGHHLPEEIRRCDPSIIVLMGGTACSLVPDIDLDIEHGIPRIAELYGWEGPVIPMYHPAAGLHDTGKMIPLLEDFERLGKILSGEWSAPVDPYPNPDYRLLDSARELRTSIWDYTAPFTAIDTERHGDMAFSVQFSQRPGTGYMVLASKPQLVVHKLAGESRPSPGDPLWVLSNLLKDYEGEVVLHNAGQDLDWLERMGIRVTHFRDTMQEAYHLGNLPQGLKALAYHMFGIRMRTYEDVVLPHSRAAMCNWLTEALATAMDDLYLSSYKPYKKPKRDKVTGRMLEGKTTIKPGPLEQALRRIYRYTLSNQEYDPWEKLAELEGDAKTQLEYVESTPAKGGRVPIVGIGHVPLGEAVRYGCQDADMTLRVAMELEKRRGEMVGEGGEWEIGEGDEDR